MTYEEAIIYIDKANRFGSVLGLDRIKVLLKRLGNPEKDLKFIHVAGTNGKGSICTFITSILEAEGYCVGRYISPTLFDYRERIQVGGNYIDKTSLAEIITVISKACHDFLDEGLEHPTIFEIETAMSFIYFKKLACDFVVLEVGLGGRFDSTNVIPTSLISVIGAIGLDHTEILGNSLGAIAFEKAGIIKAAQPVVIYEQDREVVDVIIDQCLGMASEPVLTDWKQLSVLESTVDCQIFDYKQYHKLSIHLTGLFQINNAATAIEAVWQLIQLGYPISETAIFTGLRNAKWPGRFEVIHRKPLIIADGAHNPDGARALAASVQKYFKNKRVLLVMGVFKDKDYQEILEILSSQGDILIAYKPNHERGLSSNVLAAAAGRYFQQVYDKGDISNALNTALEFAAEDDVIIFFGSLSTISQICDIIHGTMGRIPGSKGHAFHACMKKQPE